MQIGNFDTSSIFSLKGMGGMVSSILWGIGIFILLGVIFWYVYSYFKNKAFYTNPITLTQYYENGTKKTRWGLQGGKFVNKSGVWDFKIKIPKTWRTKELGYIPDFSKADADNSLHFITWGDGTIWQQTEHSLVTKEREIEKIVDGNKIKEIEVEYDTLMKPIRTDVKTVTVNSIKSWSEMVNKNKMTAFTIGMITFIVMVIAHLISLYIQTKIKCGV